MLGEKNFKELAIEKARCYGCDKIANVSVQPEKAKDDVTVISSNVLRKGLYR